MPESTVPAGAPSPSETPGNSSSPPARDSTSTAAAAPSSSSEPPAPSPPNPTLDDPYMYQNSRTGAPSASPLSLRQLCRLLCPARPGAPAIVTPDTLVIGYDPATGAYSPAGWTKAGDVSVLGEACASWHYEGSAGGTRGPVAARELSRMLHREGGGDDAIDGLTRVWSASRTAEGWKSLSELPLLKMALEALAPEDEPPWVRASAGAAAEAQKVQKGADKTGGGPAASQQPGGDYSQHDQTYDPGTASKEGSVVVSTASTIGEGSEILSQKAHDELEAFLASTGGGSGARESAEVGGSDQEDNEGPEEEYESDEGTRYVRDRRTGSWMPEHLAPAHHKPNKKNKATKDADSFGSADKTVKSSNQQQNTTNGTNGAGNKRKRKKDGKKFKARNARCWVYITGLPPDTDEIEVSKYFGRVGVIDLDPETQHPKVKLYREKGGGGKGPRGALKGDGSICYARPESVDLAIQLLDESHLRADGSAQLRVQRAKFEQHGDKYEESAPGGGRRAVSAAQRKVARLAALQAVTWDESGEGGRITGGRKGLRIIVLRGVFTPEELVGKEGDEKVHAIEEELHQECGQWGTVEKITIFSKNREGIVVIKFAQPTAASQAVEGYHGRERDGRRIDASYWDGVTDFTVKEEEKERKEEKKRHDEFGKWLEDQDLPEEFRLQVEGQ